MRTLHSEHGIISWSMSVDLDPSLQAVSVESVRTLHSKLYQLIDVCENPAFQTILISWLMSVRTLHSKPYQLIKVCEIPHPSSYSWSMYKNPPLQAVSDDQRLWGPSTPISIRWSVSMRTLHSNQYQMIGIYEDPPLQAVSASVRTLHSKQYQHLWGPSTPSSISSSVSVRTLHSKQYQLIGVYEDPPF